MQLGSGLSTLLEKDLSKDFQATNSAIDLH